VPLPIQPITRVHELRKIGRICEDAESGSGRSNIFGEKQLSAKDARFLIDTSYQNGKHTPKSGPPKCTNIGIFGTQIWQSRVSQGCQKIIPK
jgi:hypothetical protein